MYQSVIYKGASISFNATSTENKFIKTISKSAFQPGRWVQTIKFKQFKLPFDEDITNISKTNQQTNNDNNTMSLLKKHIVLPYNEYPSTYL